MMGFFDRDDNDEDEKREEVTLSVPEQTQEEINPQGKLKDEAEARLTGGSSSNDSSEKDTSGMLPGMGADTGTSASPSNQNKNSSSSNTGSSRATDRKKESVSLEDIHMQNKQIKSILKDIRSEIKDEGDMNGVL